MITLISGKRCFTSSKSDSPSTGPILMSINAKSGDRFFDELQSFFAVQCGSHLVSPLGQKPIQKTHKVLLIIDDQYRFDHGSIRTYGRKVIHNTHIESKSPLASVNSFTTKQKSFQRRSIQKIAIFNGVVVSPDRQSGLLQTLFSYFEVNSPTINHDVNKLC